MNLRRAVYVLVVVVTFVPFVLLDAARRAGERADTAFERFKQWALEETPPWTLPR